MTLPKIIYGTAWKEEETERLVGLALRAGYRAIDTANQRKHYFEAGVGAAIKKALADGLTTRAQLFLQTKFTDRGGQDQRLPYDPKADPATQVRQSFESSLDIWAPTISIPMCSTVRRSATGSAPMIGWSGMRWSGSRKKAGRTSSA